MSYFFIIVLVVLVLMYGYIGWRVLAPSGLGLVWKLTISGLIVLGVLSLLVPFGLRFGGYQSQWTFTVGWIGYMGFGFISSLFIYFLLRDIGWLAWMGIEKVVSGSDSVVDPERRRWLLNATNLGLLGIGAAATGYGWYQAYKTPRVVDVKVPIRNLPSEFVGFRIAQITDLHAGATITREFIERVVEQTNLLKPDLIALTGDLVDGSVKQLRNDVDPISRLSAPHGKFFITGNHEYYSGVGPWLEEVKRLGFDVLNNEHRIIERNGSRFVLAGVTDYTGGQFAASHRSDPAAAIAGAPPDTTRILLAHQPLSIYDAARSGYDLQISGHTHGGQYFPYHFLVSLFQPYVSGLHQHENTWIYVSRGTGTWGPQIRLGAPSEITIITLERA